MGAGARSREQLEAHARAIGNTARPEAERDDPAIKVITNHHHRDVIDAWQLTAKEREEFDYLDWPAIADGQDSASFFRYKGQLHDLGEFTSLSNPHWGNPNGELVKNWDGIRADSFFSALVVKYVDGNEGVIIGLVLS